MKTNFHELKIMDIVCSLLDDFLRGAYLLENSNIKLRTKDIYNRISFKYISIFKGGFFEGCGG